MIKIKLGKKGDKFAIVDDEFAHLAKESWSIKKGKGYVIQRPTVNGVRVTRFLHHVVMGEDKWPQFHCDHINRNKLDNRKENLRWVTNAQNNQNRIHHDLRGVSFHKISKKYRATCGLNNKDIHIGYFNDPNEAARAASEWRAKYMPYSEDARS